MNAGKVISTITNVADEREYYTFHAPWHHGRVARPGAPRALRLDDNGLPGRLLRAVEPSTLERAGPLDVRQMSSRWRAVSDRVSAQARPDVHGLMPAFVFAAATAYELHRVYVSTDEDCVNVVHRGSIVGGPAYAPRTSGPLALTRRLGKARESFLGTARKADTFALDGEVTTTKRAPTARRAPADVASPATRARAGRSVGQQLATREAGRRLLLAVVPVVKNDDGVYQDRAAAGRVPGGHACSSSGRRASSPACADAAASRRHGPVARRAGFSWARAGTPRSTGLRS